MKGVTLFYGTCSLFLAINFGICLGNAILVPTPITINCVVIVGICFVIVFTIFIHSLIKKI